MAGVFRELVSLLEITAPNQDSTDLGLYIIGVDIVYIYIVVGLQLMTDISYILLR